MKLSNALKHIYKVNEYNPMCGYKMSEALEDTDLAIIATPWKEFETIDVSHMKHKRVLDCWRIMKNTSDCDVYKAIGVQS